VAVSRKFCYTVIRHLNDDSLLVQLAVTVSGSSGKISIVASYVPPGSHSGLYQAHLDNISNIHASLKDSDGICVAGDFNLSSVFWTWDPQASAMVPGNVHHSHEIIVIDDCFSMGLTQVNNKIYSFLPFNDSNPRYIFNPSSLSSLRDCLLSLNWGALLSNPCIENNYKTFVSTIRNTLDSIVRSKVRGSYRLPW